MARTYTEAEKQAAVALYETDGPTVVRKKLGISAGTLDRWVKKAGARTNRNTKMREATQAAQVDAKARRAALALSGLEAIQEAETAAREAVRDRDGRNAKDLATVYGIFADKHKMFAKFDDDGGVNLSAVDEWIEHMVGGGNESETVRGEGPVGAGQPFHLDPGV